MLAADRALRSAASWGMAASAIVYAILHVVLLAGLVNFGRVAGGYPLQALAIAVYGLVTLVGLAVAMLSSARARRPIDRLLALLLPAPLLAVSLAGAFFGTEVLGGVGLSTEYRPYLNDDGAFAWLNVMMAVWIVALALAANWRALLVGAMAAHGLALWVNPGLMVSMPPTFVMGIPPDMLPLLAVPGLYLAGAVALGWRATAGRIPVVPIVFLALVVAVLTLGNLASALYWALVLCLPILAWRLRRWSSSGEGPGNLTMAGAGLAMLAVVAAMFWSYVGPASGMGDSSLPQGGQRMGWLGKTVPEGAYGLPGDVLQVLKQGYPWLLVAAGLIWLASAVRRVWQAGIRRMVAAAGLPGGLVMLGFAMLFQALPLPLMLIYPLPVQGLAGALVGALGQRGLLSLTYLEFPALALGLLGLSAMLRHGPSRTRDWLAFGAVLLALAAAGVLTAGLVAGTLQNLELQRLLTLPEYRDAAQLRLALSLPVNAAMALLGWVVFAAALQALRKQGSAMHLPAPALWRGLVATGGVAIVAVIAFWQVTAMPVAETYPKDSATEVPTNAPVIIQFTPGDRNWGPGISARYADTGERVIQGHSGGSRGGGSWFAPKDGWRPNSRVEVQVCCGPFSRSYRFSFTTGAGPSADVPAPPGPGPAPTPPRPALSPGKP